ncbi:Sarcosine oxidase [Enhygromyxa salina]|uniref:Sarcosine oxidase n=1 Tax=Enhygromyxa salina TaxID=215803 RepID=A0A0C1ZX28_9BACT|nr:N-methyl-L-tryptophan oxidase [Enhygromyxa salina]KIG15623.1 Sarcosine oxidase [Enhygromyxa salina]
MTGTKGPKVAVVGGGTMGLATAWALARRGAQVELFERHGHIHTHGGHSGHTRVIRHAYHEGSDYVGLVSRADEEWARLGARVSEQLLVRCGLLEFGPGDDPAFAAALAALREHEIRHELIDAATARARYGFEVPSSWPACLSPDSGYLRVSPCLTALRDEAQAHGATLRYQARVRELALGGDRPRLLLDDGTCVAADRIVVSAGAGSGDLLGPTLDRAHTFERLQVLRRVLAWTRPAEHLRPHMRSLPVWAAFVPEGFFYGFPDNDEGISGFKLACHSSNDPALAYMYEPVDPERVDRTVHDLDLQPLRAFLARYRPDAGEIAATVTCLYTNTRTEDFWIDHHPSDSRVVIATGFSGHGFKFAPVVGLAVADLTLEGHSDLALERFGYS